jgi:uncharacterized membrane protein YphA (DoxX/SURF4 family)
MRYLVLAARLLIGGLFVYARYHKLLEPGSFAADIRNYTILPVAVTNLVAITLPWVELTAGICLIIGIQIRPSAMVIAALLCLFIPALTYAYAVGLDISCGCFSSAADSAGKIDLLTLLRDGSLLPVTLLILLGDRGDFRIAGLLGAKRQEAASHA